MKMNADMSGIDKFVGGVEGILNVVESPGFQGDFIDFTLGKMRDKFRVETIAAHMSGNARIDHVFEWPMQSPDGVSSHQPNPTPLFALYKTGVGDRKSLSFRFLPSTMNVPLPDPAKYGFPASKLKYLSRHVFRMKALVMETQSSVIIAPTNGSKLFIPDASKKRGYWMSSNPSVINPGGGQATGGFAEWWTNWFEIRGPAIAKETSALAEDIIAATGQKVVRYAAGTTIGGVSVGGRFASGTTHEVGYVDAAKRTAEAWMKAAQKQAFRDEGDWEE